MSPFTRRRLLKVSAALGTTTLAGCTTALSEDSGTPTRTSEEPTPVRGSADSIEIEQTVSNENITYIHSNNTVKYPKARSGEGNVKYGYRPFKEWAYAKGGSISASAVWSRLQDQFPEEDSLSVGVSSQSNNDPRVMVRLETTLDRNGEVLSEPSVSQSSVVDATPSSVTTMILLAQQETVNTYPVYVTQFTRQQV
jgi:hypothetical protein